MVLRMLSYNPGLNGCTYRHLGNSDMTMQSAGTYDIVSRAVGILRAGCNTENFTIGMNLGKCRRGIADQSTSYLPRGTEINFMP